MTVMSRITKLNCNLLVLGMIMAFTAPTFAGPTATPTATPSTTPTATPTVPAATPTPTATPTATPTTTPTATPTATPTPAPFDCLCEVKNITPDAINLNKVGTGGKQSSLEKRMIVQIRTVDAPGQTCDKGETSGPVQINLKMVDDDGDVLIDSAKVVVCDGEPSSWFGASSFRVPSTARIRLCPMESAPA